MKQDPRKEVALTGCMHDEAHLVRIEAYSCEQVLISAFLSFNRHFERRKSMHSWKAKFCVFGISAFLCFSKHGVGGLS